MKNSHYTALDWAALNPKDKPVITVLARFESPHDRNSDGRRASEAENFKPALAILRRLYEQCLAADFGPPWPLRLAVWK
jgi:hypothetical protein